MFVWGSGEKGVIFMVINDKRRQGSWSCFDLLMSCTAVSPFPHLSHSCICDPALQNESHWYFSWHFYFYTVVKSIHFPFKWYLNFANLPTGSKVIDISIWLSYRLPFWRIGLSTLVLHTTVLQQLQFKMPKTVIKHHIWPLKVMFSHRIMPEAPDFDENQKSIFLTCRSKIVTFRIVTEYQCDSFQAIGSHMCMYNYLHSHVCIIHTCISNTSNGECPMLPGRT